jgi:diadenosine tetraphosphate (Ap4A) HIT family hydrolase
MFTIHQQLKKDLIELGDLNLSKLFLLPDINNPWFILVPTKSEISEWHHLDTASQVILTEEISSLSFFIEEHFRPDKINIGSLGNIVPQLHIHIIARYKNDQRWPNPLWGVEHESDPTKIEKLVKLTREYFKFI